MKDLQILMPMGGLGLRFSQEGYDLPKPLIEVDDKAMFMKALDSLNAINCLKKHIFVIRKEHVQQYQLDEKIKELLPNSKLIIIEENTAGAVETCLKASEIINKDYPILVMDCDLYFQSPDYNELIQNAVSNSNQDPAAAVLYFKADNPRYSYAEINEKGEVNKTAEKIVISDKALAGAYFFASGEVFLDAANKLLSRQINEEMKEYYLSLLYNIILAKNLKVLACEVKEYNSFGTPEELKSYLSKN